MKKSQSYYLKDGKLDFSLLDEEAYSEFEPIKYHALPKIHESSTTIDREKLYGSLETYEILKEMGAYLLDESEEQEFNYKIWQEGPKEEIEEREHVEIVESLEKAEEVANQMTENLEKAEEVADQMTESLGKAEEVADQMTESLEKAEEVADQMTEGLEKAEEVADQMTEGLEQVEEINNQVIEDIDMAGEVNGQLIESIDEVGEIVHYDHIFSLQVTEEDREIMKQYQQPKLTAQGREPQLKKHSKVQQFREYQLKLLEGRVLTEDIISPTGVVVGRGGERITSEMLELAKQEDSLIKIILKYL